MTTTTNSVMKIGDSEFIYANPAKKKFTLSVNTVRGDFLCRSVEGFADLWKLLCEFYNKTGTVVLEEYIRFAGLCNAGKCDNFRDDFAYIVSRFSSVQLSVREFEHMVYGYFVKDVGVEDWFDIYYKEDNDG